MPVLLIGFSHRTSPLAFLERVALDADHVTKAVQSLADQSHLSEALVLSTCNRVEVYVAAERFHAGYAEAREVLAEITGVPVDELADEAHIAYDDEAIIHLFRVAAGLESAVVGEHEIIGQLKTAWDQARADGGAGPLVNQLARHALEVAKRARSETAIGRHTASVSQAAVSLAHHEFAESLGRRGGLEGAAALVVGAGDMGRGMVLGLAERGASVCIANRSPERARSLAESAGGRAVGLTELASEIVASDVVLSGTGAPDLVIDRDTMERLVAEREGRPLVVVDVALPRDVDPAVADVDGVTLLDMDDIRRHVQQGLELRAAEAASVQAIVAEEAARWKAEASAREVTPALVGFRTAAEAIRAAELERFEGRLGTLDPDEMATVEALTKAIVAKLLHDPTVRLKEAAGTPRGERLVEAVRDLLRPDE